MTELSRVGDWQGCKNLLSAMCSGDFGPDKRPDGFTYGLVLRACRMKFKWEEGLKVFDQMRAAGVQADLVTYNIVMDMAAKVGRLEWALELLGEMKEGQVKPDSFTYTAVMKAAGEAGEAATALQLLQVSGLGILLISQCIIKTGTDCCCLLPLQFDHSTGDAGGGHTT